MTPDEVIDTVFRTYVERGHRHYGENVTETQHALQCATFARDNDEDPALVAACLLHDFGHLAHDLGEDIADRGVDACHEDLGAAALSKWFVPEIVEPVRLHVAAKRYLCAQQAGYFDGLSEASRKSLELQGGPMNADEMSVFESLPHYAAAVRLRLYDDMGKVSEMTTPEIEAFRPFLKPYVQVRA